MVAFWGYEVTETKAAVVDVPEGFVLNVVNATSTGDAQVSLGLETQQLDGKSFKGVVAHLGAKQPLQVKLDLVFGHKVKFYLAKGSGVVNLTGYFQAGPVIETEESSTVSESSKKSKKRAREEQKSWDEVSPSSSDSEEKVKVSKPVTTTPAKKEEQKKPKPAETPANTSSNPANTEGTSQKKKRKKNKNKKHAVNGEAK